MFGLKVATACIALACIPFHPGSGGAQAGDGIDVLMPVEGSPWSSDRMRGARERLNDILPGHRD